MKRTLYSFVYMAMVVTACTSCVGNDDELGTIETPASDYVLPQGKDETADQIIVSLYQKYGTYFLYDFTEKDFQWSLVNANKVGDDTYRYDPIVPSKVAGLLEAIQKGWLDFYSDDFLKKAMPYRVFLAEDVQVRERTFDWSTWEYVLNWVNKPCRHLANQMAIGNIEDSWTEMSARKKRAFKSFVQADFLQYCVEQGVVSVPDEFYAVSDYGTEMSWSATSEDARKAGFVYNPQTELEWSIDGTISKSADISAFLASLAYNSDKDWETNLSYSLVKQKYEILVGAFEAVGIDIKRIGNTSFE